MQYRLFAGLDRHSPMGIRVYADDEQFYLLAGLLFSVLFMGFLSSPARRASLLDGGTEVPLCSVIGAFLFRSALCRRSDGRLNAGERAGDFSDFFLFPGRIPAVRVLRGASFRCCPRMLSNVGRVRVFFVFLVRSSGFDRYPAVMCVCCQMNGYRSLTGSGG